MLRPVQLLLCSCYRGADYCDQRVCLLVCVSVREHISRTAPDLHQFFCACYVFVRGPVLICRRCDTSCTSGLINDVTFLHGIMSIPLQRRRHCSAVHRLTPLLHRTGYVVSPCPSPFLLPLLLYHFPLGPLNTAMGFGERCRLL